MDVHYVVHLCLVFPCVTFHHKKVKKIHFSLKQVSFSLKIHTYFYAVLPDLCLHKFIILTELSMLCLTVLFMLGSRFSIFTVILNVTNNWSSPAFIF